MRVTIDIQDAHAIHVLDVLRSISTISIIKTERSNPKKETLKGFQQAIEDVKLAKEGKLDLQTLDEFLDEV